MNEANAKASAMPGAPEKIEDGENEAPKSKPSGPPLTMTARPVITSVASSTVSSTPSSRAPMSTRRMASTCTIATTTSAQTHHGRSMVSATWAPKTAPK